MSNARSFYSADRTGLEPATSAVTGRHSNQLNYRSLVGVAKIGAKNIQAKNKIKSFEIICPAGIIMITVPLMD